MFFRKKLTQNVKNSNAYVTFAPINVRFAVLEFPYIFRHRRSWASTFVFTIHTDILQFLALAFVDVPSQNHTEIVRKS